MSRDRGPMTCLLCREEVLDGDVVGATRFFDQEGRERQAHIECGLREVMGGIGHHLDHAYWCGEQHDPDGGLSYRESARRVWALTLPLRVTGRIPTSSRYGGGNGKGEEA